MDEKYKGTIVHLNEEKGFGFIEVEGYDKNIFFHAKDCRQIRYEKLRKNDIVQIGSIESNDKGFTAREVYLVK